MQAVVTCRRSATGLALLLMPAAATGQSADSLKVVRRNMVKVDWLSPLAFNLLNNGVTRGQPQPWMWTTVLSYERLLGARISLQADAVLNAGVKRQKTDGAMLQGRYYLYAGKTPAGSYQPLAISGGYAAAVVGYLRRREQFAGEAVRTFRLGTTGALLGWQTAPRRASGRGVAVDLAAGAYYGWRLAAGGAEDAGFGAPGLRLLARGGLGFRF